MKRVLILGASGGIGQALVRHGRAAGHEVVGLSRRDDGFDVTDAEAVARGMGHLNGAFDVVFVATGALVIGDAQPEKTIRHLQAQVMADQYAVNAIGPALILKELGRVLPRDRRCFVGVLSARVGSIGDNRLGGWYSYRAAKAGLNQIVHSAAIEFARTHPEAVFTALHPGTVATAFTERYAARHDRVAPDTAAANLWRLGETLTPAQSGGFFDYSGAEVQW